MKSPNLTNPQSSPDSAAPQDAGLSPWQRLKSKRISYLTLPLLVMATVTEFVILATGWKYQQVVCLPKGMGVVFLALAQSARRSWRWSCSSCRWPFGPPRVKASKSA
jgi:hypothetical protein